MTEKSDLNTTTDPQRTNKPNKRQRNRNKQKQPANDDETDENKINALLDSMKDIFK